MASPTIGGAYTLSASFGAGCGTDSGNSVSKSITVGRLVRHSVAIKTSTSSAKRNPTLTLTGKIFWGAIAQSGVDVDLVLTTATGSHVALSATTNDSGVYTATYGGDKSVTAGTYTVVTTLRADGTYAGSVATSRTVTIRK